MITLRYRFEGCFSVSIKLSKNFSKTYNKFLRNTIPKLYNAVSAPVTTTPDALAERLQSVRVLLLYCITG